MSSLAAKIQEVREEPYLRPLLVNFLKGIEAEAGVHIDDAERERTIDRLLALEAGPEDEDASDDLLWGAPFLQEAA